MRRRDFLGATLLAPLAAFVKPWGPNPCAELSLGTPVACTLSDHWMHNPRERVDMLSVVQRRARLAPGWMWVDYEAITNDAYGTYWQLAVRRPDGKEIAICVACGPLSTVEMEARMISAVEWAVRHPDANVTRVWL